MRKSLWLWRALVVVIGTGLGGPVAAQQKRRSTTPIGGSSESDQRAAASLEAAPGGADTAKSGPAEVQFRAGSVDIEPDVKELLLTGNVEVVVDRYRLSADRLGLKRGPYGLELRGDGEVAFCRCESAPVTFGFSSAIVAPPTDLLLTDPTARVGGVPVCWAPYLWLRSPRRPGLLPPVLAWRGHDGFLAGSGIHWPLARDVRQMPTAALDLRAAGYVNGGFELRGTLGTQTTSTRWRWDWLERGLVDAQSHGALRIDGAVSETWQLDVLRGARALEGAGEFSTVAKPYDRVRATLGVATDRAAIGWGLRSLGARGAGWSDLGTNGPWFGVAAGRPIGSGHTIDGTLGGWVARGPTGDEALWSASTGVGGTVHDGLMRFEWQSGGRGALLVTEKSSEFGGNAGVLGRASLPLVRDFGSAQSPLWHWAEPFAIGVTNEGGGHDAQAITGPHSNLGSRFAGAGMRNALELRRTREAVELTTVAGSLWQGRSEAQAVLAGRLLAQADAAAASTELVWRRPQSHLSDVSLHDTGRLGERDEVHVTGWVDGSRGAEVLDMRQLLEKPWDSGSGQWHAGDGWSAGSNMVVPWARWLVSSIGGAIDLTRHELLGANADVAYRHPCGCLAVLAEAQRRLGRRGYDAAITIDLMP